MASNTTPKTIVLRGEAESREFIAAGAITPGHLLVVNSANKVAVHATAAGVNSRLYARHLDFVGKGIDDAYAANDSVMCHQAEPGDHIYGWLKAGSAAVVIGDYLESAGNGSLQKATHAVTNATTAAAMYAGRAVEAIDNSGGGSDVRIRVEVI